MTSTTTTIRDHLSEPIRVDAPDVAGPLAVFPLFGPEPSGQYLSLAKGRTLGVKVGEDDRGASVRDIVIQNRAETPVLLYEGEEVLGAQQNRTFDVSVLVPAKEQLRVPVSCVEAGRWDDSRHAEDFAPAPQHAYPELRRMKNRQAREAVMQGREARAVQSAVWDNVASKSDAHDVSSPTGAMHDIYETHRGRLAELSGAMRLREGQCGALVAIGGRFAVLDYVGRADVFADLFGPLVQGYALDALDAGDKAEKAPSLTEGSGFVSLVLGTEARSAPSIGLGQDLRFAADGVAGAGLATDGGLAQLTAFPDEGDEPGSGPRVSSHIRRPSRRRRQERG